MISDDDIEAALLAMRYGIAHYGALDESLKGATTKRDAAQRVHDAMRESLRWRKDKEVEAVKKSEAKASEKLSKATTHKNGVCLSTEKRRIGSKKKAENAAADLTRQNLKKVREPNRTAARAYHCQACGGWHLTSMPWSPERASLDP